MTGLYERTVAYGREEEGERVSMVAYSELLLLRVAEQICDPINRCAFQGHAALSPIAAGRYCAGL
jgi:hypothetical protein